MHGGTFDHIVHYNHDKLTAWETLIATKDDNWLQCSWFFDINNVRYKVSITEHSNCGNYIYSKEVIDNKQNIGLMLWSHDSFWWFHLRMNMWWGLHMSKHYKSFI